MAPVALAFAVLELTDSASALGIVLAARMLPTLLFLVAGGVWADRLPRHHVLVGSSLIAGASQGMVGVLLVTGAADIWHLVLLEAVNGAAGALYYPADSSILPQVVPADRLQPANAIMRLGQNAAMVGGAALAGVLVAALNPGWTIVIDAATFFAGAAIIMGLRDIPALGAQAQSFITDLVEGWHEFRAHRWLWAIVLQFSLVLMAFLGAFDVLGPLVANREMDGARSFALIVAAQAVGWVAGGVLVLQWRARRPILVATLMVFLMAVPIGLLALGVSPWWVAAGALIQGAGMEVFSVLWYTAMQENVAPEALSRVSSYDALGSLALAPLGIVLAGPLEAWLGLDTTLWLCVAVIAVPTALVLLVPEVRQLRSRPGASADAAVRSRLAAEPAPTEGA